MTLSHHKNIQFTSPLLDEIRQKGYTPVDMHIHTHHSDAAIRIRPLLTRAHHLGIGVAVTDRYAYVGDHGC